MQKISSPRRWLTGVMRWTARLLSIPWSLIALFGAYWAVGNAYADGGVSGMIAIIVGIIVVLLFLGAAVIASVWRMEKIGGIVLLVDGMLILACIITMPHGKPTLVEFFTLSEPFNFILVLPPMVAGAFFLICHRRSMKQD